MKKKLILIIAVVVTIGLMPTASFAEKGGHGYHKKSMKDKFFKKVKMIYLYQDDIGVNDKQLDQITELKVNLKKDLIRKGADVDVLKVDIKSMMYEDEINLDAINGLIDQKYEIKKAKSKSLVAAFASLKKILTDDQMDKLKSIYHEQKKAHMAKGSSKGRRK